MADSSSTAHDQDDLLLAQLTEEFADRIRSGEHPSVEEYVARAPGHEEELRELLATVTRLERADPSSAKALPAGLAIERIGEYRIERELGRGGMGVVFLATQESLDRRVALKLLPVQATLDPRFLQRFQREARAAAQLSHPHIVSVHGVGEHEGLHYYAMQYVEGHALDEVVRMLRDWSEHGTKAKAEGSSVALVAATLVAKDVSSDGEAPDEEDSDTYFIGAISPSRSPRYFRNVARIGVQVAEALAYAHSHGVLHRDIKPSNLLMDANGRVSITDFGLCKTGEGDQLTATTDLVGTLRYMAPEQIDGRSDVRSDVYGLGITLYELLTLRPAFRGSDRAGLMKRVLETSPTRPRRIDKGVPPDLEAIVLKATAKLPEERYGTADALGQDLRAFAEGRAISARPPSALHLFRLAVRRNKLLSGAIAAFLLVLFAGSLLYIRGVRLAEREQERRLYFANIAATEASVNVDTAAALRSLEQAPEAFRNWEWDHYRVLLDQSLRVLGESRDWSWDAAMTPDGRHLVVARDRRLLVRDLVSETEWSVPREPAPSVIIEIDVHPDGRSFLAVDNTGGVTLWSLGGEPRLLSAWNVGGDTQSGCFDSTGERVFIGLRSGVILCLDVAQQTRLFDLRGHASWVDDLVVTPDGRTLVSAGRDAAILVWDLEQRRERWKFHHEGAGSCVDVTSDGALVASGSEDGTVRLWSVADGSQLHSWSHHTGWVNRLAFSPDDSLLVSASSDRTIHVMGTREGHLRQILRGHSHEVQGISFGSGSDVLVSTGRDGMVLEWDVDVAGGFQLLDGHAADVWHLTFDASGEMLVSTNRDGTVRVWDAQTGRPLRVLFGHEGLPGVTAVDPGGDVVASGDSAGRIRLWDLYSGMELDVLDGRGQGREQPGWVTALHFDPSGKRLFAAILGWGFEIWSRGDEGWSLASAQPIAGLRLVLPDSRGRYLALGWQEGEVGLLDLGDLSVVFRSQGHEARVSDLEFHPAGGLLASSSHDGHVRFWNIPEGDLVRTLAIEERPSDRGSRVIGISFSPDGSRLACSSSGLKVSLWDVDRGELVTRLRGPGRSSSDIVFSPDGKRIAAGTVERLIHVWDTETSAERRWALEEPRSRRKEAAALVDRLHAELGTFDAVNAHLLESGLDAGLREAALALSHERAGTIEAVKARCRRLLRSPGADPGRSHRQAFVLAAGLEKDHYGDADIRLLAGEAAYRAGRLDMARSSLEAAVEAASAAGAPSFEALVYLSMTYARQGDLAEARSVLDEARGVMGEPALFEEAESVLADPRSRSAEEQ